MPRGRSSGWAPDTRKVAVALAEQKRHCLLTTKCHTSLGPGSSCEQCDKCYACGRGTTAWVNGLFASNHVRTRCRNSTLRAWYLSRRPVPRNPRVSPRVKRSGSEIQLSARSRRKGRAMARRRTLPKSTREPRISGGQRRRKSSLKKVMVVAKR